MKNTISALTLIFTLLLAACAFAADKVVVIPLNSSKPPTCTLRESNTEYLDTWYKAINVTCSEGEIAVSGGFTYGTYNTTLNCRVIRSRPNTTGTGWEVTWGMPTEAECAERTARTYALCCKW